MTQVIQHVPTNLTSSPVDSKCDLSKLGSSSAAAVVKVAARLERDVKKFLRCRVCSKVPCPPIYECTRGHIICGRCWTTRYGDCVKNIRISYCNLCQDSCPEGLVRNFLMEDMIQKSTFKCEYLEEGCAVKISGGDLQKHVTTCGFRPIRCHMGRKDGCNHSTINFSEYTKHLERIHHFTPVNLPSSPSATNNSTTTSITLMNDKGGLVLTHSFTLPYKPASTRSWKSYYINFDGKTFIPRICTVGTINMIKLHVAILAGSLEASKYCVRIRFQNKSKQDTSHHHHQNETCYEFKIPVYSIRKSDKDVSELHQAILNYGALQELGQIVKSGGGPLEELFQWDVYYEIIKIL